MHTACGKGTKQLNTKDKYNYPFQPINDEQGGWSGIDRIIRK